MPGWEQIYKEQKNKKLQYRRKLLIMLLLTIFLSGMALCLGRYSLSPGKMLSILFSPLTHTGQNWSLMDYNVVFRVRLPRVCAEILIGGGLALSGATYQGIFRNPLVSPDLLGISAGACVGAASAILLDWNSAAIQVCALAGGIIAVACSLAIPRILKNNTILMLVLSGVIVSGFMDAIIGILKYVADVQTQLPAITYWQMGSLAEINPEQVLHVLPAMAVGIVVLLGLSWQVNLLSLGETESAMLGVNQVVMRTIMIVCATLLTGCSVCLAGIVGWVGLIIPHFTRLLIGSDNVRLMPFSFLLGACFMIAVDTLARTATSAEIPISILTGIIGTPFFIWMLAWTRTRL